MTIKERLMKIETDVCYIKKLMYVLYVILAASTGIQII